MTLTLAPHPDLTTGDPFTQVFGLVINGVEPAADVVIKAAIVDMSKTITYIEAVTCTAATAQTIVGVAYVRPWQVSFSDTQTKQLLTTPTDLGSSLSSKIAKGEIEENGYGYVLLEIQVGSPYFVTRHTHLTVGKGLIA